MVCVQVIGFDAAVAFAGTQGDYQLSVYKPVMVYNVLESIKLLAEASASFDERCAYGIEPNLKRINENLSNSLMVVTALNPHIGQSVSQSVWLPHILILVATPPPLHWSVNISFRTEPLFV